MPAILKSKHQSFTETVKEIEERFPKEATDFVKLKDELDSIYRNYRDGVDDIKAIILEYARKQRQIKNKMKQLLLTEMNARKKESSGM